VPTGLLFRSLVFLASLCCGFGAQDRSCLLSLSSSVRKTLTEPDLEASELELLEDDPYVTDIGINISEIPIDWHNIMCNFVARSTESGADVLKRLDTWPRPSTDHGVVAGRVPRGSKCAVVSNSGVLLAHEYGAEIDSADLVFRFNDAAIGGDFKKYVGERDDIRLVNGEFGSKVMNKQMNLTSDPIYVLLRPLRTQVAAAQQAAAQHPDAKIFLGSEKLALLCSSMMRSVFGAAGKEMLTSGFLGLGLALTVCDDVKAYGFADTPTSAKSFFHYYGEMMKGSAAHNDHHKSAIKEKVLWKRIASNADVDETDITAMSGKRACAK